MAYASARETSPQRLFSIGLVLLIHAVLAWALISGFAFRAVEQARQELKTFNVVEPAPPAPEPAAPEPEASAEPTEMEAAPSPVPPKASQAASSAPQGPTSAASASAGAAASGARLKRGAFHNERDYPSRAKSRGEQGTVRVSYTIGIDGRVSNCTVAGSSGSPSLDSTTCRILERRFRYEPARDASGLPVPQTKTQSVSWVLEE